jgi:hypothetical protein
MPSYHQKQNRVNIELYMQSGIVESYALGLATLPEKAEFEQLLPHYPELKEALTEFEYHLELFAIDHETPPPPDTVERIAAKLRDAPEVRRSGGGYRSLHGGRAANYLSVEATSNHIRVHKIWRTLFIAVFILAKIFLILAIYYFIEYRSKK